MTKLIVHKTPQTAFPTADGDMHIFYSGGLLYITGARGLSQNIFTTDFVMPDELIIEGGGTSGLRSSCSEDLLIKLLDTALRAVTEGK